MKLRLSHKVLLLLAVPVAFQLGFWLVLNDALAKVERAQVYERDSRQSMILRAHIHLNYYEQSLLFAMFQALHDDKYAAKFNELDGKNTRLFKQIAQMWSNDDEKRALLRPLYKMYRNSMNLARFVMFSMSPGNSNISSIVAAGYAEPGASLKSTFALMRQSVNGGDGFDELVRKLEYEEQRIQPRLKANIDAVNNVLLIGSVLSLASTLGLGIFFAVSISERLKKVLRNIRAMETGQPVVDVKDGGGDEIAQLDRAIIETAGQIREAEQFQAQTTQLVAQELNKPLQEIAQAFHSLREDGFVEKSEKTAARLDSVSAEVGRLRSLVDDLLILEQVREAGYQLHIGNVDLSKVAHDAVAIVRDFAASRDVSLSVGAPAGITVRGDAERLIQVAVNLLSNAIKFSPEGSNVRLLVDCSDSRAKLSVSDEGPGIPHEFQSRIFSRFEQAPDNAAQSGSSGLGLAICKKLVEAQSGQMGFSTVVGSGSTFWLTLPLASSGSLENSARQPSAADVDHATWKPRMRQRIVLLVALPLAVQMMTVLSLGYIIHSAQDDVNRMVLTRRAVEIDTQVMRDLFRATFLSMVFNLSRDESDRQQVESIQSSISSSLSTLKVLSKDDASIGSETDALAEAARQLRGWQNEIISAPKDADLRKLLVYGDNDTHANLLANTLEPGEHALVRQATLYEESNLAQQRMQSGVRTVMLISTATSSLIAIVLGLLMTRQVTSKVEVLVSNTVQLQKRLPLAPELKGDDELAYVDHAFHQAGTKLTELDRFKQEMVAATSHELRTPLTSLLGLADLVQTGVFGALTKQGEKTVRIARRQIGDLISLITNLLDLEKMQSGKSLIVPKPVELRDVVYSVLSSVEDLEIEHQIAIETEVLPGVVNADADRLVQALASVLTDVASRAPKNSIIRLEQLKVAAGSGIRIIEKTTATESEAAGNARWRLNLGLAELIAKQHQGRFAVETSADTRVYTFELPN